MKTKEQIELAERAIEHLEDYVVLAKAQKKLKTVDVDIQLETVETFIKTNVEKL